MSGQCGEIVYMSGYNRGQVPTHQHHWFSAKWAPLSIKNFQCQSRTSWCWSSFVKQIRRERNYQTRDKYLRNAANSSSVSPAIGVVQSGDQGVTNMCGAKILLKQTPADWTLQCMLGLARNLARVSVQTQHKITKSKSTMVNVSLPAQAEMQDS